MTITAADIRREVKEKNVTFLRLMFSDIAGTLKNVKSQQLMSNLTKYCQTSNVRWIFNRRFCTYQRI